MLVLNPDLINSCRVCRSPNQDGDYQCLYQAFSKLDNGSPVLSEAGILYENLFDIALNVQHYYPQFLCNSCELQMRLFKKLKDKAYKNFAYLQSLYGEEKDYIKEEVQLTLEYSPLENEQEIAESEYQENYGEEYQENVVEFVELKENEINECNGSIADDFEENGEQDNNSINELQEYIGKVYQENTENSYEENVAECEEEKLIGIDSHKMKFGLENLHNDEDILTIVDTHVETTTAPKEKKNIASLADQVKFKKIAPKHSYLKCHYSTDAPTQSLLHSSENIPQIDINLDAVIDKNDYVTEIYELLDDECKIETYPGTNETDMITEETETNSGFSDLDYIVEDEVYMGDDTSMQEFQNSKKTRLNSSGSKKRKFSCKLCQLEFTNLQENKLHRTEVHGEKYPCNVCSRELKSKPALHHHMKIHNEHAAYQCEICQKTFNQKAHYQYHMNRHNNVRNFKCNVCEKAFLSKADLKVHMRFHTGQRPYVCNICGKDYLMMEHLKTHMLTHTDQYFQCEICSNKFTTHKTLRLHVKTIHEDEPRFKCTFCTKSFRRKHHLEYHLKLHQKNVNLLDSQYQLIEDQDAASKKTNLNADSLDEQESTDDPGFIALSDD